MSAKATFWAWEQPLTGNDKLVLLCYADFANDYHLSWPSKQTVARQTGVSLATVKRSVKNLIEQGVLLEDGARFTRAEDSKTRETACYKLNLTRVTQNPVHNEPGSNGTSTRVTVTPNPTISNNPTIDIDNPNPTRVTQTPVGFDEFYEAYPKKVQRQAAIKAFKKLKPSKTLLTKILNDIAARLKAAEWSLSEKQYIPNPSTYLNGARWEDEIISNNEDSSLSLEDKTKALIAAMNAEEEHERSRA